MELEAPTRQLLQVLKIKEARLPDLLVAACARLDRLKDDNQKLKKNMASKRDQQTSARPMSSLSRQLSEVGLLQMGRKSSQL